MSRVQELDEAHQAYFLLKSLISAPRLLYLLCSSPAHLHPAILSRIDEEVRRGVINITNVALNGTAWRQATLPVSLGGLGIGMVADLALPTYLASTRSSAFLATAVYPPAAACLRQLEASLLQQWLEATGVKPPEEQQQSRQHAWDRATATAVASQLLETSSDDTDRARLRAAAQPQSGAWLNVLPVANLGTLLDRETLRTAVALRVGVPVCATTPLPLRCHH